MKDVKWIEGAPKDLKTGMLVRLNDGRIILIGHSDPCCRYGAVNFNHIDEVLQAVIAHAWLIQPNEIKWLESMAKAHKVGRPAEGDGK